ncbi:unnamed protein product [Prorocentrum cordatum]|uniref:Uncharacterized protein n=1 Tax=Prorocentrum cordatum TaxID=2364126 RepID=A0ABN9QM06_9DINO|nr:unnamed protein product [Polarella glacialis]
MPSWHRRAAQMNPRVGRGLLWQHPRRGTRWPPEHSEGSGSLNLPRHPDAEGEDHGSTASAPCPPEGPGALAGREGSPDLAEEAQGDGSGRDLVIVSTTRACLGFLHATGGMYREGQCPEERKGGPRGSVRFRRVGAAPKTLTQALHRGGSSPKILPVCDAESLGENRAPPVCLTSVQRSATASQRCRLQATRGRTAA